MGKILHFWEYACTRRDQCFEENQGKRLKMNTYNFDQNKYYILFFLLLRKTIEYEIRLYAAISYILKRNLIQYHTAYVPYNIKSNDDDIYYIKELIFVQYQDN